MRRQGFWSSRSQEAFCSPSPCRPTRWALTRKSTLFQEFSAGIDTWPLNQPGGLREQRELNRYLDQTGDYRNGSICWSADLNKTTFTGYLGQAALLKAGEIFRLPFSMLFKLGRLGNLLIYALAMALAIRKTPVGKGMLAFIGLMPAPMMLAGVYSYDPTVTAFTALSCAYILEAVLNPAGVCHYHRRVFLGMPDQGRLCAADLNGLFNSCGSV